MIDLQTNSYEKVKMLSSKKFLFTDPHFEAAVRETLSKLNCILVQSDFDEIEELDCVEHGIKTLDGIEKLRYLRTLQLSYNNLCKLFPLGQLKFVEHLYLNANHIKNLQPLQYLTTLRILDLRNNKNIEDISPLSHLWRLQELHLDGNKIIDIKPLINLRNLNFISLANNFISDISSLSKLANIHWLSLEQNRIEDISPLVENNSFKPGTLINLSCNNLDVKCSPTLEHIQILKKRDIRVLYDNQKNTVN